MMPKKCSHDCVPGNSSKCTKACFDGNEAKYATEGQFKNGKPLKEPKSYRHEVTVKGIKIEWGKRR